MRAGITVERGSSANKSLVWDEQNDYWDFGTGDDVRAGEFRSNSFRGISGNMTITSETTGDITLDAADDIFLKPTGDTVYMQGVTSGEQITFTLDTTNQTISASDRLILSSGTNEVRIVSADLDMNNNTISNLAEPDSDHNAATKSYVDNNVGALATTYAIAGDAGTDTITLASDTLTFTGGVGVTTTVTDNTLTINGFDSAYAQIVIDSNFGNMQVDTIHWKDASTPFNIISNDRMHFTSRDTTGDGIFNFYFQDNTRVNQGYADSLGIYFTGQSPYWNIFSGVDRDLRIKTATSQDMLLEADDISLRLLNSNFPTFRVYQNSTEMFTVSSATGTGTTVRGKSSHDFTFETLTTGDINLFPTDDLNVSADAVSILASSTAVDITAADSASITATTGDVDIRASAGKVLLSAEGSNNIEGQAGNNIILKHGSNFGDYISLQGMGGNNHAVSFFLDFGTSPFLLGTPTSGATYGLIIETQEGGLQLSPDAGIIKLDNTSTGGGGLDVNTDNTIKLYTGSGMGTLNSTWENDDLTVQGDVTSISDVRTKENIQDIENGLSLVETLRGVWYHKIGEEDRKVGVIAQEVEEVLPEVVKTDAEGMKSVDYGKMVGVLIEAIKELKSEVDELKTRLGD